MVCAAGAGARGRADNKHRPKQTEPSCCQREGPGISQHHWSAQGNGTVPTASRRPLPRITKDKEGGTTCKPVRN